jgi:hypothetical protein
MGRDQVFGPNHSMEREIHASIEKARAEIAAADTYEDAICMVEGHVHGSREAEAICSLRWQLAQERKLKGLVIEELVRKGGSVGRTGPQGSKGEEGPRGPGPCCAGPPGPEGHGGCISDTGPTGYEVELANDERESVRWLLGQLREQRERLNNLTCYGQIYPPELLGDMVHTCPKCGHDDVATHSSVPHLKAEIARLQGMITGPTGPNDGPIGRCGYTGEVGNPDSARAVGCRDIDICDEVKRLKAEIAHLTEDRQFAVDDAIRKTGEILLLKEEAEKNQATFRALSGPILPELLVGIATGRVHLALQAQITMQPRPEPKDFEERVLRAGKALWDAGVTVNMADPSSFEEAKEQFCKVARYVLEEAAPKANTCAPSKEGLLDKEVEDHG